MEKKENTKRRNIKKKRKIRNFERTRLALYSLARQVGSAKSDGGSTNSSILRGSYAGDK